MAQENVQIVRAAVEAFNSGDIDAVMAYCDADAVLDEGGQVPDGSVYHGPAEIRRCYRAATSDACTHTRHQGDSRGAARFDSISGAALNGSSETTAISSVSPSSCRKR